MLNYFNNKIDLYFCVFTSFLFLSAPVLQASSDKSNNTQPGNLYSCSFFDDERFGSINKEELKIPEWNDEPSTETIRFRYHYLYQPNFSGEPKDQPQSNQFFELHIDDAMPLHGFRTPFDDQGRFIRERLTIELHGSLDRPIWVHLNNLDSIDSEYNEYLKLENGDTIRVPRNYKLENSTIDGFWRLYWTKLEGIERHDRQEHYVGVGNNGEISELLRCTADHVVPFPSCRYSKKEGRIFIASRFDKSQINKMARIRSLITDFSRCTLR